ncbi:GNAT family N-acetyltransferase [Methylomonas methanica]|uniref:GCN5-related N-acetyltransferase n=1 Tax=Methylomonas methanica (strain DSM 25384 / MC09) TaxID=857087 RepID=G0A5E2_METMM|nr:GNAT family N-acetyltransferase [Methylomonas methanica]AEG01648.1 GCN5-related N-acetyltransferase [Methylomonas methanica MC09]
MNITNYYLEPANFEADYDALHSVRHQVFVVEQRIPAEIEFDELDRQCHHFIARDEQSRPIATGRLSPQGKIGRMAVLRDWRGQRVGQSLLRVLIEKARALGLTTVSANAQVSALEFYRKLGFVAEGAVFQEAGIPHQTMLLPLPPVEAAKRPSPRPKTASIEASRLETLESAVAATLQLIQGARRQLTIYSRDLEYALYGQPEIVEALKQLALRNRGGGVRIIIQEPANLRGQTHPLLELAQRLTSHFQIRTPVESEDLQYLSAFLLNDSDGYLFRLLGNRYEGHWSPNLPARNRRLQEEFERVWQRSVPCSEFRVLGL